MIQNTISQYVRTMFEESRDGFLTVGDTDDRFACPVAWDEVTANALAQQCGLLIGHLTELSGQYETLLTETRHLTEVQFEVWNTYLRPFPRHGLDMEALRAIWEKLDAGESVTPQEHALARRCQRWFERNALARLPVNRCDPTQLIRRARRFCTLIRLKAPAVVLENEGKRFAEEYVLYHCMKENVPK